MFGFNTAVQALLASQRSLYITNHNIANTDTEGYSRQQGAQRATNPMYLPGIGFLGTGTEIYNIERIRDSYVDFKYWNESAPEGEWQIKKAYLSELEKLFGEPSDSSFRQYLDDFYVALDNMGKNPSDLSFREPVKENATALTKHINETAVRLMDLSKEISSSINAQVKKINGLANQIASLNRQIYSNELDGRKSNDLRDRRELLIDELSGMVNVKVDESADGKFRVSIGGVSLVDHINVNNIRVEMDDNISIRWNNNSKVGLKTGELKGLLDLYRGDGQDNTYRGIPYYQEKLNEFAKGFAEGFNDQHRKGYGIGGYENGKNFFDYDENNPAATIGLSHDIDDIRNIGAAGNPPGNAEDNQNLLDLIGLRDNKEFFSGATSQGTPDDFLKAIISNLAVDSTQGKRMYDTQNIVLKNIEGKRNSISGVSYDEEMADMVRYQHTYIASAKMISTMDIIMDVTINRLGLVGR